MIFPTFTDFQSYLLPGTDSWALPEEKAVSLLNYLKTRGITQVYCIPPVTLENPGNTADALHNAFLHFHRSFSVECKLRLAARYRLDDGFMPLLKAGELLSIGRYLIVDVSPLQEHRDTWEMITATVKIGYTPIVMQPERVAYWEEDAFIRLREAGALLMLNMYSLFGYNGDYALMYSRQMLAKGMYEYVCSGIEDTRNMRYSENFTISEDAFAVRELGRLEENGRGLWKEHLAVLYSPKKAI